MLISEIDSDSHSDHYNVKHIEKHYIPMYCFIPRMWCICGDQYKFADKSKDISYPDEEVKRNREDCFTNMRWNHIDLNSKPVWLSEDEIPDWKEDLEWRRHSKVEDAIGRRILT